MLKVGVLGLGKMGEAMALGLKKSLKSEVELRGTVKNPANVAPKKSRLGFSVSTDNRELVQWADVLILGVKPYLAEAVIEDIRADLTADKLLLSVCASVSLDNLKDWTTRHDQEPGCSYVRVMPNLPSLVGEGMTIYCYPPHFTAERIPTVEKVLRSFGRAAQIQEKDMDAATAISGCGPAYFFMMIEALSDAGVKLGLTRKLSIELAAQTMAGSARMVLETGAHPESLKDEVTTPGGVTIEGVVALEEGQMRSTLMKAVFAAARRSAELRKK